MQWTALVSSMTLSGCNGIEFDPDFHTVDVRSGGLVNERGEIVFFHEEAAEDFACMHQDKIIELSEILTRARRPRSSD